MAQRLVTVVATFHDKPYSDKLSIENATIADVRKFVAVGCKMGDLPPHQFGVFCHGLLLEEEDLLADINFFEFDVRPRLQPVQGAANNIKAEEVVGSGGGGSDAKPLVSGAKRSRVGEIISQSLAAAFSKTDRSRSSSLAAPDQVTKKEEVKKEFFSTLTHQKELESKLAKVKEEAIDFNFILGTVAQANGKVEVDQGDENVFHDWIVYVRDTHSSNRDLSGIIEHVTFELHETFPNCRRKIVKPPFQLTEEGWGQFSIGVEVKLKYIDQPLRYVKLLAFGQPLILGHVIPPNPPREEPAYHLPPFARHKKPVVDEVHQQVTLYNPHPNVRAALGKLNTTSTTTAGTTSKSNGGGGIDTKWFGAILDWDKEKTNETEEQCYQRLSKIRQGIKELNTARRREAETEMVSSKAAFFDVVFKEELRGVAGRSLGGGASASVGARKK